MKKLFCRIFRSYAIASLLIVLSAGNYTAVAQIISLAGDWQVQLGSQQAKAQAVKLPGTLDDAKIGVPVSDNRPGLDISTMAHLARRTNFVGKAYYTKTVSIPVEWKEKRITLSLGRVIWRSQVLIDGMPLAEKGESLVSAHVFDLSGKLVPGKKHKVTLVIDNSNIYPGINIYEKKYPNPDTHEMVHGYTNHTQIKWNGVLGHVVLTAKPKTCIKSVSVDPDVAEKKLKVNYRLSQSATGSVRIENYVRDLVTKKKWGT
ncbi:MAG: hypothetical protein J7527_19720, partial [Chitinophagaceae bacterium]|nr:hypothetical protein [Chitinophagaceae bacterium]